MAEDSMKDFFATKARSGDGAFAITWAIIDLADAQEAAAKAIQRLGVSNASTPLGAIEYLGGELNGVASAIESIASIIQENPFGSHLDADGV